jgi:hypothetical protein
MEENFLQPLNVLLSLFFQKTHSSWGKNILEAFGIKSTEWWPLMEFEAPRSGLIGKNPFLFLSP